MVAIAESLATDEQLQTLLMDSGAAIQSGQRFFVCDKSTYTKDTELSTLLDPLTGLPFPLMPDVEDLPIDDGSVSNWHHGFHPHSHPVLATMGGKALRSAQIQLVRRSQHNHTEEAFHRFEVGPVVHQEVGHQIGVALLAAAGCSHRVGIVTHDDALWLQPMTDEESGRLRVFSSPVPYYEQEIEPFRERMRLSPDLSSEEVIHRLKQRRERDAVMSYRNLRSGYDQTRNLLIHYVLSQDLSNINRKAINKFKNSGDSVRGHRLLVRAAHELVQNVSAYNGQTIHELYADLHSAGMLNPNMPDTAGELVKFKLGSVEKRISLLPRFRQELLHRETEAA